MELYTYMLSNVGSCVLRISDGWFERFDLETKQWVDDPEKKLIWCGENDDFHDIDEATALAVVEKVKKC